jgi:translation initiation factor 1
MKNKKSGKIELTTESSPLQSSAFSALGNVDVTRLPVGNSLSIKSTPPLVKGQQRLVLRREKKDRGGKTVVVITGFDGNPNALDDLARKLRKQLGCGGTTEGKEIVIQGDQPTAVAEALKRMGHQVRGVGI